MKPRGKEPEAFGRVAKRSLGFYSGEEFLCWTRGGSRCSKTRADTYKAGLTRVVLVSKTYK
jgi:hypothetical protein